MLDFENNRIDYGTLLNPPDGFRMERAIGTTYSLDLITLLSIPVALFYKKTLNGKVSEDRMDIFDAIQKSTDTISIYCQKGKIKVPKNYNRLISFIEDCAIEILPEYSYQSFHPKVWVIRYSNNEGDCLYRHITLSRNLTFDRSYDIAFATEGYVGKNTVKKNKPIVDFVDQLAKYHPFKDCQRFIADLSKVNFVVNEPFMDYSFHPMGFGEYKSPLMNLKWKELIIISPFLQKDILLQLSDNTSGNKYLFSRKEELDKIPQNIVDLFKTYCFSKNVENGEETETSDGIVNDNPNEESLIQNLHAKLFIGKDEENINRWYLGSANCTMSAMEKNTEFLIHLAGKSPKIGINKILPILLGNERDYSVFDTYNKSVTSSLNQEYDFRSKEYDLLTYLANSENMQVKCVSQVDQDDYYTLLVDLKEDIIFKSDSVSFHFSPYGHQDGLITLENQWSFEFKNISLYQINPFFEWKIVHKETEESKSFLVKLCIQKLPENRREDLLISIIQDKERLFQFIRFLLGSEHDREYFRQENSNLSNSTISNSIIGKNMYEELLLALLRDQAKLKEIKCLIDRILESDSTGLIPDTFLDLWTVIKTFIANEE